MTLREFFEWVGSNPTYLFVFFASLPITAILAGVLGKNEGHISPWKYLYSFLAYAVCIPGIFSVAYSVYRFLFEKGRILDANIYTQFLPVMVMFLTLWLMRQNVTFDQVPGFGKISTLMGTIATVFILMWLVDKIHIYSFTYMPIQTLLLIVVGAIIFARFGIKRMLGG